MEVNNLKGEINAIKMQECSRTIPSLFEKSQPCESSYHTDEEQLLEETFVEEISQPNKKRKYKPPTPPSKNTGAVRKEEKKAPLPPPIKVSNITDINVLKNEIKSCVKNPVSYKALANGEIKITTADETDYRKIKSLLKGIREIQNELMSNPNNEIDYHTYQLKSEKLFRFVARGLPPSTSCNEIKNDVEKHGHTVTSIMNVIKKTTKDGKTNHIRYPLFYIDILPNENNKDVYKITGLADFDVKIEAPKKTRSIPQCTNCQQLGHTKNYCNRKPKCVKCAGDHVSSSCEKQRDSAAKCALCGKDHTSNYKGCEVYQKKLKEQQPKKSTVVQRLQERSTEPKVQPRAVTPDLSYAQATKDEKAEPTANEPTIKDLMALLCNFQTEVKDGFRQLATRVEKLEKSKQPKQSQEKRNG